jgi:ABC-type multidrug transport system fused ATPase/permease subunit
MDPLILQDEEERRYYFHPLSLQFTRASEWDGAVADAVWVWPWIKPYRARLIVSFFLFLFATLTAIAVPRIVAKIVDDVLLHKSAAFLPWASLLGGLMVLKVAADLTYKWMVTRAGQRMTKQLRNDVFHQLGSFPLSFFDKNSSGRLISRCVNDVSNLSSFFTASVFTVGTDIVLILGCAVVMLTLSVPSALIIFAALIPMGIFMMNVSQAQMRWGREQRNVLSRLSSHAADTMNNLGVLHSQPFALKWARRHGRLQNVFAAINTRSIITWGSFSSTHVLVMGITYTCVIIMGVHQLREQTMTIGEFIASCTYVGLIFGPFFDISEKLNTLVTALGSAKRLRAFLPAPIRDQSRMDEDAGPAPHGPIRFEHIRFGYRSDRVIYEDLNLELPEGEVTALVGRTGSGKTTLAHLMLGLYPLQHGKILWGDEDLLSLSPERRSRWVGHVSQDLFLFTDTLRENLRLWRDDISDEQIFERLKRVGLDEKIRQLPGGLEMLVKAETLPLSQGEKQLMLLCRTLLQDPRLLVFDEATANLDQLSEEQWLLHVNELFEGRTTLFIAHRLETLRLATNVVVLENGRVLKVIRKAKGTSISEGELH